MILSRTYWTHFAVTEGRGVARIFQRGVTDRDTIRGSPTIYGLYRCSPSCISGLSRIIAAWRPTLTKDKSRWRKYFTKTNLKKQILKKWCFLTVAFTDKILSWRFRHLNIAGCLLKRRPTKGGSRAPPPLATPLEGITIYPLVSEISVKWVVNSCV